MFDPQHWAMFLAVAIVFNASPGPDILYVLSRTVAQGRRIGFASSLGVASGALIHVGAASVGLTAILATSAAAYLAVKYAGAAYLLYLGVKALRSGGTALQTLDAPVAASTPAAFRQGLLVDLLNPKVALFFMAFLPQFIDPALGQVPLQIVLHGLLVVAVGLCFEGLLVLMAARMTEALRRRPAIDLWLNRLMGTVLIGLGLRLAAQQQR